MNRCCMLIGLSAGALSGEIPKQELDWEELFIRQRIIWQYPGFGPHASYTLSKKHSDFYFNSDFLSKDPTLLKAVCLELFNRAQSDLIEKPDWIVTYPPYGLNLGFCLAELFGCRFAFLTSLTDPQLSFDIHPGDKVLFCADDLYSGGSFLKVQKAVEDKNARLINPLVVVGNFSGNSRLQEYSICSLIQKEIHLWEKDCPLCSAGSKPVPARLSWVELTQ